MAANERCFADIELPRCAKQRARKLLEQIGTYYGTAQKLGNPNLRATLWRFLNEDGFKPSKRFLAALRDWSGADPLVITAESGSALFGEVSSLELGEVVIFLVMLPEDWERHSIPCQVCQAMTPRWSSSQKYCEKHSWTTPEGRRYHRQQQKEAGE